MDVFMRNESLWLHLVIIIGQWQRCKRDQQTIPHNHLLSNPQLWNMLQSLVQKLWTQLQVLFENVCHLETLVFETVSRLSSSSHLIKGKLAPMVLPLDIPWCPVFLGIGIDPQRIPRYPCRWHVTLGILSPQVRIIHTEPKQTETNFQTRFSKCLATVSHLLEPWFLNPVTWQSQTSTTSLVISPTLYGKVLVAELNALSAEQWQQC